MSRKSIVPADAPGVQPPWVKRVLSFTESMFDPETGAYRSVPNGPVTLYGTAYMALTRYYLGLSDVAERSKEFVRQCQIRETGEFLGPELIGTRQALQGAHDLQHRTLHLSCAVIPMCHQFDIEIQYPLRFAHKFVDLNYLSTWLNARDWKEAWLEGNNLLFVGQLLVYLRDHENYPGSQKALTYWFDWLDDQMDPQTGLWGTNGHCTTYEAMYGGYHQLLVYYYENHPLPCARALIDTTLRLRHPDGGFCQSGGGGTCEDVDAVDILVNMYKLIDYKHPRIRVALRRIKKNIMAHQNSDGGFPYKQGVAQSHMGIPATEAEPNVSTAFATWFRTHTLALTGAVLTDDWDLTAQQLRFNKNLSMGWYRPMTGEIPPIQIVERAKEFPFYAKDQLYVNMEWAKQKVRRILAGITQSH